jgi:GntR family transcriptional regulator
VSSLGVAPIAPPIHPRSPVPKYSKLREVLLELIESELTPDAPIPSERELAQRHGLHRMTVRQAVDQLVSQGRLYRVPRRGTFVARPKLQMRLTLTSFTQDMRGLGLRPGAVTLAATRIPAGEEVGSHLGLPHTAEVHMLERLRTAGGVPMAIERTHLPADLTPGLLGADLANQSLYAILAERYEVVLDHGEQTIQAGSADSSEARVLGLPVGEPVLKFQRTSFAGEQPVEFVVSTYRGDRYQFRVALDAPTRAHPQGGIA